MSGGGRRLRCWGLVLACCAGPLVPARAAPTSGESESAETVLYQPGSWGWDEAGWRITPSLGLLAGWNDNLRLSSEPTVASRYTTWLPGLAVVGPVSETQRLSFNLGSELTRYHDSPADNTFNTELALDGAHLLAERTALAWKTTAQDWHDIVGVAAAGTTPPGADHFRALAAGAVLRHDAGDTGDVRTELEFSRSGRRYLNHREFTRMADLQSRQWTLRGLYRLEPGLHLGAELRDARLDYPDSPLGLDNRDQRLLLVAIRAPEEAQGDSGDAGASPPTPRASGWVADALAGQLRLGWQRKSYRPGQPGVPARWQGKTLEADGSWQLASDHLLGLSLGRAASDAPGGGANDLLQTRLQLNWTYRLQPQTTAMLGTSAALLQFQGGELARREQVRSVDLVLRHDLSRRCQIGFNLGWARRLSDLPSQRYVRHLNALTVNLAL